MTDRVGLGIIGLGRWSNAHAKAAARSETVQIVNCYSRTSTTRDQFAATYGIDRSAESIQELIADPRVEGLIVSTPNDLHAEHVLAALAAGKPALVDKPLSVDVAQGLDVLRAADRSGIPVGVAHHARRLAGHRAAKEWIESGRAGSVRMAHGDFSNSRGAHLKPDAWHRTVRGSEAGVLIQVGIHQVDNLLYLLGPVTSLNARFEYFALGPDMPDAAALVMTHVGGAISTVTSSWTTPGHYRLDILATGGNLGYRLDHGHWPSGDIDDYGELILDPADGERAPQPIVKGDPLRDQLDELGRAARDRTPMLIGVVAGLRAVAVVEGAVQSARRGGEQVSIEELIRASGGSREETARLVGGKGG